MEERLVAEIKELESVVTEQFELLGSSNENQYLTSGRSLNFRAGPSADDEILNVLPQNKSFVSWSV